MHFSFYDETEKLQQEFIATTDLYLIGLRYFDLELFSRKRGGYVIGPA
jgi:hypothetical protein